jgi:hypothetical protein
MFFASLTVLDLTELPIVLNGIADFRCKAHELTHYAHRRFSLQNAAPSTNVRSDGAHRSMLIRW